MEAETLTGTAASEADTSQTAHGTALEIRGLTRRFGEREALRGVDASLDMGETLVVFGPNGAGKTTLLRVLATLLLPQGGEVRVLGHQLPREATGLRPKIGFLGHEPLLYRELSGRENLIFYARLYAVREPAARVDELLAETGMYDRGDDPVRDLSRGMVQRLAVCRAVLHRPSLLLLDEPRAGLDPDASELVEPLIGRDCRCTRVLVTHDIEAGLAESERVLCLREGRGLLHRRSSEVSPHDVRAIYAHHGAPAT